MTPARLCLAFAALLLTSAPGCADIVIGAAGPFSSPYAGFGEQLRRGVQMAVDDINARGGVGGEHLSVQFADDGCDPRKAVDVATTFVSAGVKAVIGHYCSGASIPASKVYLKANIVEISPASTHPKFTDDGGWNVLRLCPRDDAQADAAANLVQSKFAGRKVAILNDQSAGQKTLSDRFRSDLKAKGVTAVFDEAYKPGAKDYSELANRLKAAGAEVIYIAGSYVEGGLIVREMRDLDPTVQFIAGDALVTDEFYNVAKDAADGTLMTFTYDPRKLASARSVLDQFKQVDYGAEGFTLYAYAAVEAWTAAVVATGSTDSIRVAQWLRGGNAIDTVVGKISFDAKGDLTAPKIAWYKWINGHYAEIDPATLLPPVLDTTP